MAFILCPKYTKCNSTTNYNHQNNSSELVEKLSVPTFSLIYPTYMLIMQQQLNFAISEEAYDISDASTDYSYIKSFLILTTHIECYLVSNLTAVFQKKDIIFQTLKIFGSTRPTRCTEFLLFLLRKWTFFFQRPIFQFQFNNFCSSFLSSFRSFSHY